MSHDATNDQRIPSEWTVDPASGRSNSSPEYLRLGHRVGEIIRDSAHDIVQGRTDRVGLLIMAQLAHVEHMVPSDYQGIDVLSVSKDGDGNYSGLVSIEGEIHRFTTQPYTPDATSD